MKRKLKHYLISIQVASNAYLHAYLMTTNDARQFDGVCNKMMDEAEKIGSFPMSHIILSTDLDTGAKTVRKILSKWDDNVKQALKEATDYHLSIWLMDARHPDNERLMELH